MNPQELDLPLEQASVGMTLARNLLDTAEPAADLKAREAAQRLHHQERLVRLFRHVGENPDGRHLMNLMARYREVELS